MSAEYYRKVVPTRDIHRGKSVICLYVAENEILIRHLKTLSDIAWGRIINCWYIPSDHFKLNEVFKVFLSLAYIDYSALCYKQESQVSKASVKKSPLTELAQILAWHLRNFK